MALREKLIVMVKAPRAGTVKTRLARVLGDGPACEAYKELVGCLLNNLAALPGVELRFAPDDALNEIKPWLVSDWSGLSQGGGDLGQRLARAVQQSFAQDPVRLVIVGSDCPWVGVEDIRAAWGHLADHDLVIGPARDGGYWLIGMNHPHTSLFEGIAWSSERVLQQTLDRARELGLRTHCLRTLSDVDEIDDWEEFKKSARG